MFHGDSSMKPRHRYNSGHFDHGVWDISILTQLGRKIVPEYKTLSFSPQKIDGLSWLTLKHGLQCLVFSLWEKLPFFNAVDHSVSIFLNLIPKITSIGHHVLAIFDNIGQSLLSKFLIKMPPTLYGLNP